MKSIVVVIFLLVVSPLVLSEPEIKGSPNEIRDFLHPNKNRVQIIGNATLTTYSDKAIVSLLITTEDDKLSDSIENNSQLRTKVTKQLVDSGINSEEINSSKFSTSPQYGWFGTKPSSYKVINRTKIGITNESQLKEIALVADLNDEIDLVSTTYEHTEKPKYKNDVKRKALDDVNSQKNFYEKILGIKLIPIGFHDIQVLQRATEGALLLERSVQKRREKMSKSSFSSKYNGNSTPSSFEEVKYEANITVEFKIDDNTK